MMTEPRIFQGSPLAEVSLDWYMRRSGDDDRDLERERQRAAEVAPGVFVSPLGWGNMIMPDHSISDGPRIAVWDERANG
jgi:hypothetical protein